MTRRLPVLVTAAVAALAMAACAAPGSGGSDSDATDGGTIRIGVIGASDTQGTSSRRRPRRRGSTSRS
ncbi:hypothetical protein [Miniimonas arenae]|uniref:hypothetical protein n=1 Tax=Miniimonas arenae TaxID=676201 RepID=UPI0028AB5AB8|nr:hypothetical protein [Miniimonas arenae]